MEVKPGDVLRALMRHGDPEGDPDGNEEASGPVELYRIHILSVDGESVVYRRQGGEPGETTRTILQAAVERGDIAKVPEDAG